ALYRLQLILKLSRILNGLASEELKISKCLAEKFSMVREPLLKRGKVASDMTFVPQFPLFDFLTNALIQDITRKCIKQLNVNVLGCKNITIERFKVEAPTNSPNTDGIHTGQSGEVNTISSDIKTGDDCISIGYGTKNVDIKEVTCGLGHGISIGSLGKFQNEDLVEGIKVSKCTITNTSNGVFIKSWPSEYPRTGLERRKCASVQLQ
ncbi:hypothetical protein Golax_022456, partial [Gossypium laxum]|nr:hypothetical protein [Gossypium laxum]